MKNKNVVTGIKLAVSAVLAALFYLVGVLISGGLGTDVMDSLTVVAIISFSVILVMLIFSIAAAAIYNKRKRGVSVADTQKYFLARKSDAERSLKKVSGRIRLLRITIRIYTVLIFLLNALLMLTMGASGFKFGIALFSVYIFFGCLGRIKKARKGDFSGYTDPGKYPYLHSLAKKAAKTFGIRGNVRIMLMPDCNAGIARIGGTFSLQLGIVMLYMLSEEELYQVLLHEFAHMTPGCIPSENETELFEEIASREKSDFDRIMDLMFAFFDRLYLFEYFMYRTTASLYIEKLADDAVLKYGTPEIAASALMKIDFYSKYEFCERGKELFFEPEEMRRDGVSGICREFKASLSENEGLWRHLIDVEIEPRSASHPILRNRLAALGVSGVRLIDNTADSSSQYRQETEKAVSEGDEMMYEYNKEDYAEKRRVYYLEPLETVRKWEESGRKVLPEEARPVIDALCKLNRIEEAEELCDKIISESENVYATAHAHFVKGQLMTERCDKGGIDHLYKAIEINKNYTDSALELIGNVCCMLGLSDELEKYREFAVKTEQEQRDKYSELPGLKSSDKLVYDSMPADMRSGIVSRIVSIEDNRINRIYLVRKIITDDIFTSAFVIRFLPETDENTVKRVMDNIFNYLDTYPVKWQFSLFLYDPTTAAAVKKVKNSLLYSSEQAADA